MIEATHAVFIDGTWQHRFQERPTMLAAMHGSSRLPEGRKYYDAGVGTRFPWMLGGAFGLGVRGQIKRALDWIVANVHPNEAVALFGGSRGATVARRLAYECYTVGIKVAYLGVFDTVGAMGVPTGRGWLFAPEFKDKRLGDHVHAACHLVAKDETRWAYSPTLWSNVHTNYRFTLREPALQFAVSGNHGDLLMTTPPAYTVMAHSQLHALMDWRDDIPEHVIFQASKNKFDLATLLFGHESRSKALREVPKVHEISLRTTIK